eukprot:9371925-Lingulodinium_polyedra.AAC.1
MASFEPTQGAPDAASAGGANVGVASGDSDDGESDEQVSRPKRPRREAFGQGGEVVLPAPRD